VRRMPPLGRGVRGKGARSRAAGCGAWGGREGLACRRPHRAGLLDLYQDMVLLPLEFEGAAEVESNRRGITWELVRGSTSSRRAGSDGGRVDQYLLAPFHTAFKSELDVAG
jgi:hypothetical protein